jgi:tetratricopeptide (TPR) repeat protein
LEGQLLETLGTIELERGNYASAEVFYQQSLAVFERIEDISRVGVMLNNLGEIRRRSGHYEEAVEYFQRAREIARKTARFSSLISTYNNEGQTWLAAGDIPRAIKLLHEGLQVHTDSGQWDVNVIQSTLPEIHSSLAEAYARQGDIAEAWEQANRALELAQEFNQVQQIARAYQAMAFINMHDPNSDDHVLDLIESSRQHWHLISGTVELGRLMAMKGDYFKARNQTQAAEEAYISAIDYLTKAQLHAEAEAIRQKMG